MSLSDSDIEEGVKKVNLAHEDYAIPASMCKPEIEKFYDEIHTNIDDLNGKLIGLFKKKEDDLCNMYKREMTKAQKRLRELQECTSEAELNKRKIEKKEKLQKERQKFLETSIFFSNQCKEFKDTLTKVVNTTKDLEAEINFLNEQIVFADRHNERLSGELNELKSTILRLDPTADIENLDDLIANHQAQSIDAHKQPLIHSTMSAASFTDNRSQSMIGKYVSPYSKKTVMKPNAKLNDNDPEELERAKAELKKQKEINEKLQDFLADPCFQDTEFERIFMDCVVSVRQKRGNSNHSKLPNVKGKDSSRQNIPDQASIVNTNDSTMDFTTISELDFNEYHKRQILDEFLSKEEIKKYLYILIFSNNQPKQQQQQNSSSLSKTNTSKLPKRSDQSKPTYQDSTDNLPPQNFLDELKKN